MEEKKYYHYTHYQHLSSILESGYIKLATASTYAKKEKAVAWVSLDPHWENTATKVLYNERGEGKRITFEQQLEIIGCARIQVRNIGLHTWGKLKYKAKMNFQKAKEMEQLGVELGAKTTDWYGSLKPITRKDWLSIEMYEEGIWKKVIILEEEATCLGFK